jgi:hypothetical protein
MTTRHDHHLVLELVADYLRHHPTAELTAVSVRQLQEWAASEAAAPTEPPAGATHHGGDRFSRPDTEH